MHPHAMMSRDVIGEGALQAITCPPAALPLVPATAQEAAFFGANSAPYPVYSSMPQYLPYSDYCLSDEHQMMTSLEPRRKRRRVITRDQRKAANVRERRRMYHLNEAFDDLRERVPTFAYEKKLSRIETLKLAVSYIQFMGEILTDLSPSQRGTNAENIAPVTSSLAAATGEAQSCVTSDALDAFCSSSESFSNFLGSNFTHSNHAFNAHPRSDSSLS